MHEEYKDDRSLGIQASTAHSHLIELMLIMDTSVTLTRIGRVCSFVLYFVSLFFLCLCVWSRTTYQHDVVNRDCKTMTFVCLLT
jgi:hypothetical protein